MPVAADKVAGAPITAAHINALATLANALETGKVDSATFAEQVQDAVAAMVVAGSNVTKTYDDTAGTLTLAAAGGSGVLGAAKVDAQESTTSVTPVDLATVGPVVTVTVPASGKAVVNLHAGTYGDAASQNVMGFSMSGANTAVAGATNSVMVTNSTASSYTSLAGFVVLEGLTPGVTTFTAKFWKDSGGTAFFRHRRMSVEGVA